MADHDALPEERHLSHHEKLSKRVMIDCADGGPGRSSASDFGSNVSRDSQVLDQVCEQPFIRPSMMLQPAHPRHLEADGPVPPSYHAVISGLLYQRSHIKMHQAHLMEMGRALERTLDEAEHATAALFGVASGLSTAARRRAQDCEPDFAVKTELHHSHCTVLPSVIAPTPGQRTLEAHVEENQKFHRLTSPFNPSETSSGPPVHTSFAKEDRVESKESKAVASLAPRITTTSYGGGIETRFFEEMVDDLGSHGLGGRGTPAVNIAKRLQTRLGVRSLNTIVTAQRMRRTLARLGSYRYSEEELGHMLEMIAIISGSSTIATSETVVKTHSAASQAPGVLFRDLVRYFIANEPTLGMDESLRDMMTACREILLAGDANRLVAEVVQVNVDDIAQRTQTDYYAKYVEPFMSVIILINTVCIGLQVSDESKENSPYASLWFWADTAFTLCFLLELVLRVAVRGWPPHKSRQEYWWNIIDTMLVVLGLTDFALTLILEATPATNVFGILRPLRLLRLSRLLLVFRAKHLRELALMMKGLFAGMRTLFWANILLLFAVYLLGLLAKKGLGGQQPQGSEKDMFRSVPLAMLTVFRCLMGDCMDEEGRPIVFLYYETHGAAFVLTYLVAMMFCVFGLFNLIFAIYIETTLAAARKQRKMDKSETVRVARLARELLKKFALAQALLENQNPENRDTFGDTKEFRKSMRHSNTAAEMDPGTFKITRELFELVLKDSEVGALLDALDIADHVGLFDILDADSSGAIEATELIHGLLQVRGEAKKSDMVANLLAVRAVQSMLRHLHEEQNELSKEVKRLASSARAPSDSQRVSKTMVSTRS